jgi:uncharacterized membrane protein HdeD (DUF308 family)
MFLLRVAHVIRENPWARALLGGALIVFGLIWLVVGAGHGRLVAVGALLLIGGVGAGVRGLRTRRTLERGGKETNESPSPDP